MEVKTTVRYCVPPNRLTKTLHLMVRSKDNDIESEKDALFTIAENSNTNAHL